MMLDVVDPESRKIFTAIHSAPGATPDHLARRAPTMVPMTCVPWPSPSPGVG